MLHNPTDESRAQATGEIVLPPSDREILRRLVAEVAEIAELPVQAEKAAMWRRLNDLDSVRPMVWINEVPWHEMNVDDELTLRSEHPWARGWEGELRRTLYQWRHMRGDMVVSDYIACPLAIQTTGFGIVEDVDVVRTDDSNPIVSRHFRIQIRDERDLDKIKMPRVTHDVQATEAAFAAMCDVADGIMPVRKVGQKHIWFTPWDFLIRWWGVAEAMTDLLDRPALVNAAVERMVQAWMTELDQFVEQNLLSLDCDNGRVGSGGYGYASELPGADYDPSRVRPHNMWGCSNAQIFSDVSPEHHWEFALRHDIPWLSRWGLNYYGCCEPLDGKMEILRRIPRLRKISMSPWIRLERAARELGGHFAFSYKPNPAFVAEDRWRPELVRDELTAVREATRGCHVELILKDISTVRYDPRRLWEWESIAMEVVRR
jgi:hypothetical protein